LAQVRPNPRGGNYRRKRKSRVEKLLADACASASMSHCHHLVLSLGEATLSFANRLRDYELALHCIEHRPGRANKPGETTDNAGSATKPEKSKPRKMNRMNR